MARALSVGEDLPRCVEGVFGQNLCRIGDSWWQQPILHCFALLRDADLHRVLDELLRRDGRTDSGPGLVGTVTA